MGSKSVKPTAFLCVNLPTMSSLRAHRVRKELPKGQSLGKDAAGGWKTETLKEYAPASCKAIAHEFLSAFDQYNVATGADDISADFVALCTSMLASTYGLTIGHGFAG